MTDFNSLTDVLVEELGDLYNAEQQLVSVLPVLAGAAHAYELRNALEAHLDETRMHVERLEQVFDDMGIRFAPTKTCKAMEGLVARGQEVAASDGDPVALDAALIGAAQRIEHYEIASYGTARALAGELGLDQASALLDQSLEEEGKANKALNKLATGGMMTSGINRLAAERSLRPEPDVDPEEPVAVLMEREPVE